MKKIENQKKVKEAELARKEKDRRIAEEKKARGEVEETGVEDSDDMWARNRIAQPAREDSGFTKGGDAKPKEDGGFISRKIFGQEKPKEEPSAAAASGPKRFTNSKAAEKKDDVPDTGFSRTAMGT